VVVGFFITSYSDQGSSSDSHSERRGFCFGQIVNLASDPTHDFAWTGIVVVTQPSNTPQQELKHRHCNIWERRAFPHCATTCFETAAGFALFVKTIVGSSFTLMIQTLFF